MKPQKRCHSRCNNDNNDGGGGGGGDDGGGSSSTGGGGGDESYSTAQITRVVTDSGRVWKYYPDEQTSFHLMNSYQRFEL